MHQKISQPAGPVADQLGGDNGIAPIVIAFARWRTGRLPAAQGGAGRRLGAFAQQDGGGAGFACRESQPAAGDQIQAAGIALHLQQQDADMGTAENVAGRRQGVCRTAGAHQNQLPRIAAQFEKPGRGYGAIFQGLVVRPDPEEGPAFSVESVAGHQHRQRHGKAAGAPVFREDFVQCAGAQSAAQHCVCLRMTQ